MAFSEKVTTDFENRAKRQAESKTYVLLHGPEDYTIQCMFSPFCNRNFQSFPVWMQTIKTSIRRYSGEKNHSGLVGWLYYCFTALRHILGHFERGHLAYPHCSWASLLGSLPVLSAHSFANNWQMPFLNQRKGDDERRNFFMTKFPRKNVPGVRIEPATVCLPGGTRIWTS